MAGMKCPECGKMTFFNTPKGRKCTNCGFEMIVPPNEGKSGKGTKCSNCGRNTVFNNKCTNCGTKYSR